MPSGFQAFGSAAGFVGSPAFSPDVIAGVDLWLRADLGLTLNAGNVSAWADQSGTSDTNKNALQSDAARQPIPSASDAGYNGQATLNFATGRCLETGTWTIAPTTTGTLFAVGQFANAGAEGMLVYNGSGQFYLNATDDLRYFQGTDLAATGESTVGAKHVYCVDRNGASSKIYQDAITELNTGNAGTGAAIGLRVGAFTNAGLLPLNGKIAEVISYNRVLLTAERTQVLNYLGTRYGVTIGA